MPMADVEVAWEIAADEDFDTIVRTGTEIARPELGHSVHAEVSGLEPGREYWYRFHAGDEESQTGRTKTAPARDAAVDRLRFGLAGCNHYETEAPSLMEGTPSTAPVGARPPGQP